MAEVFGIRGEHITLGQLVKFLGVAGTGGDVKLYLATDPPRVNNAPESRRGRKLRPGDVVLLSDGREVRLTAAVERDEA